MNHLISFKTPGVIQLAIVTELGQASPKVEQKEDVGAHPPANAVGY